MGPSFILLEQKGQATSHDDTALRPPASSVASPAAHARLPSTAWQAAFAIQLIPDCSARLCKYFSILADSGQLTYERRKSEPTPFIAYNRLDNETRKWFMSIVRDVWCDLGQVTPDCNV